jgi:hypothetical protein
MANRSYSNQVACFFLVVLTAVAFPSVLHALPGQTTSQVFFVSRPDFRVDAIKVAEQVEVAPAEIRALAALRIEGSIVAESIRQELPAGTICEALWIARGAIVRLAHPTPISRLRQSFPQLQWESLEGFSLLSLNSPDQRLFPALIPTAERAPHFWNLRMSGAYPLRVERNLTGKGILIGVLGVKAGYSHPVLQDKITYFKALPAASSSPAETPPTGGDISDLQLMHPLGILAGYHPDLDFSVAPQAKIALATLPRENLNADSFLSALQWLLEPEVKVRPQAILLGLDFSGAVPKAVKEALISCRTAGVLPIIAAGNNSFKVAGMAALPDCVTVGALDQWGKRALFSGQGPALVNQIQVIKPDLMQPGVGIYGPSTDEAGYRFGSGTLQAAAHFAGIWALLREARPLDESEALLTALISTTQDLGDPGKDNQNGFGLFNPAQALYLLENPPPPPEEEY